MQNRALLTIASLTLALAAGRASAFTITPTFINQDAQPANGIAEVDWNADEQAVVQAAISAWTSRLAISGPTQNVNINFEFVNDGPAELAQWTGQPTAAPTTLTTPDVFHLIDINTYYLDPALANPMVFTLGGIASNQYDALTAIEHELGHAMGFNTLYTDATGSPLWSDQVSVAGGNAYFDAAGLDIPLYSIFNTVHTADGPDLMAAHLFNGTRKTISDADLNALALTYGYTVLPAPEPASLGVIAAGCVALLNRRRRRS